MVQDGQMKSPVAICQQDNFNVEEWTYIKHMYLPVFAYRLRALPILKSAVRGVDINHLAFHDVPFLFPMSDIKASKSEGLELIKWSSTEGQ